MLRFDVELPSLDLEDLGFQTPMIDVILATEKEPEEESVPELEEAAVSRLGHLWELGPHRVLNGDARLPESYAKLLPRKAQAVFADPPFGCPVDGFVATTGRHREFAGESSGMTAEETKALFEAWHRAMVPHIAAGAAVMEVIDWRSLLVLQQVTTRHFGPLVNLAVWVKDRAGQGSFLRSLHASQLVDSFQETNRRGWRSEAHAARNGRMVLTLTHPGRADWRNPGADPTPLVRRALANYRR